MLSTSLLPWEIAVLAGASLLICALSTSMAMESAALFVPAFLLFFPALLPGFPPVGINEAIGLTLIIMFFGQTSANVGYWIRGQIDVSLAGRVLIWTIPMAIVGRIASYFLPETLLLIVFAGLLIGLSGVLYRHASPERKREQEYSNDAASDGGAPLESRVRLHLRDRLSMSGGGVVTGLVGLGMGEVSNTLLTAKSGMAVRRSIGTSTLILYLTVAAAAVTNLALVQFGGSIGVQPSIPWAVALIIAPVVVVGGQIGAYLNSMLPERLTVQTLIALYTLVAIVTVFRAFG